MDTRFLNLEKKQNDWLLHNTSCSLEMDIWRPKFMFEDAFVYCACAMSFLVHF